MDVARKRWGEGHTDGKQYYQKQKYGMETVYRLDCRERGTGATWNACNIITKKSEPRRITPRRVAAELNYARDYRRSTRITY